MIKIVMTGMCEGCMIADLYLNYIMRNDGEKLWFCECNHRDVCEWMEARTIQRIKKEVADGQEKT